jgi:hypothetical protein
MSGETFDLDLGSVAQWHGGLVKFSLLTALAISLSLASCAAKSMPTIVTVKVADTYSGPLHLKPCEKSAKEPAVVDQQGNGETSACPYGGVEIVVIKQTQKIYITSEQVRVDKTGDGIPVAITARVP